MAQPRIPIVLNELLNLNSLGVPSGSIKIGPASMQSDRYITVCCEKDGKQQIVIVDLANGNQVTQRPISAQAAIMNPISQVIALRADDVIQIFNLELKSRMKSHTMTETIVFWRWINNNTIALVTPSSVMHWSLDGDSAPEVVFERHERLAGGVQIINYDVSPDEQWCLLCGISQGEGGAINGTMQLYSMERSVSQVLQGHTGTFALVEVEGRSEPVQVVSFEEKKEDQPPRLFVMEVRPSSATGSPFKLTPQNIPVPPTATNDFPVIMKATPQGLLYMISKGGFLYLFDLPTGKAVYRAKVSNEAIFAACLHEESSGILGISSRTGRVLQMSINPENLVPYILETLSDSDLAISISARLNLPGASDLYAQEFNRLAGMNDVAGAARIAVSAPGNMLRTHDTINRFQNMQGEPGKPQPVFQYFYALLEKTQLLDFESLELVRPVVAQGRSELVSKWLNEDKLTCTEQLGDMLMQAGQASLAQRVYEQSASSGKVIGCMLQQGDFDNIVQYASAHNVRADYSHMLQQLVRSNPQGAVDFAKKLATASGGPLIDLNQTVDIFMSMNLLRETTAFLLKALEGDRRDEGYLQTRLLEINLRGGAPQVADAILENKMFTQYDRQVVGMLCEQAGLHQRALEHYTDPNDIKRIMNMAGPSLNSEFVLEYFGSLVPETSLEVLRDMLAKNMRQNLNLVVQVASRYYEQIGTDPLITMFEEFKTSEGLFYFLTAIVNFSHDAQVHFKYIQAAARMQQFKEVERICKESEDYDPEEVKDFLISAKLSDPRPLIHVCNRFDYVDEMTSYLIENNMMRYIEVYCQKVAPEKTPQVIGKLLDLDTNEDFVRNLLNLVGNMCPVDELVEQVERRNRLRLLQPWLEVRVNSGDTHPATHNAIGKIYITLNREPKQFLEHNQFYDPSVIGQFCERLDPSLAVVAYKHAGGACDQDLIRVTNENGLFKDQARYLIERQDLALWKQVLQPWKFQGEEEDREDDLEVVEGKDEEMMAPHRRALIDQVVQTALPETQNPDEVSSTVRAFMDSELHEELIELLERIVLQGSDFSNNRNLQNLLILTAIKSEPQKVSEFVSRLDNFDGPEIAKIAVQEEYGLYEEAFAIYQKCGKRRDISDEERESHHVAATEVLVKYVNDLTRAQEFAERINLPSVWSVLACAQMGEGMLRECIASFIRANDSSRWVDVLRLSEDQENFDDIIPYLQMARRDIKEAQLDTALIYALARNNNLAALEEFVGVPNVGNIQGTGERCYNEQMFDAAKVLFRSVNNNAKLALCHVALNEFREAVDSATKANSISTWKAVNIACVRNEEFRLANTCGLHIIIHPDHLEELIHNYEELGYWEELLKLLEQGLGLEAAHNGIFTQLGVLYTRYAPEKLMEHIKIFHNRMNIVKVLKACETAYLWDEAVYLYKQDKQYDSAVRTMIAHSCSYDKDIFLDCVQKVRNPEIQYQAIAYFDEYHPIELERLLQVLTPTLDHARVVHQLRRTESLVFAIDYLKSVQKENVGAVNEALNEIYIDEEDYNSLRASIDDYDNFDQMALAQRIEKHELLEFRRIAAHLYRKNGRHQQSIDLSRKDSMFRDAIETAAESQDHDLVEDLLRYFVEVEDKACFTATLYTCYDFIRPDVAMELAWRHGYMDYAMPYMIQYMHHLHNKVTELEQRTAPPAEEDSIGHNEPMHMMGGGPMGMFETPLALTNGSMMMGSMITGPQDPFDEMHHQNAHHQQQAFHSFGGNMGGGMGGNMGNMGNMGGMGGNMGGMGGHMGGGHNMGGF